MPHLKTMRILNDIYTVFQESDFELRTNRKQREKNLDKLQICININGTVTVAAPCKRGSVLYMTFEGNGRIDLWDWRLDSSFYIERNKYSPEEIRKKFHKEMTDEYGLEFKNGEHQLHSPNWPGMLCSAKIIPQVYKVFHEDDFSLIRSSKLTLCPQMRFEGYVDCQEGKLTILAWIDHVTHIRIVFDGSDTVTIAEYPYNDGEKIPVNEARNVLVNTYGVSFLPENVEADNVFKVLKDVDEILKQLENHA